ncbi:MAG: Type IV pilus assembly protein PilM [Candidatus Uhrbacteria bacterium GW2011_GWE2_40_58]|nr:MAG: Type IV pilus assembly protein PilM [Candidatus Uhrbacteria bacterium GW2011_GWF2_40_263]KKR67958.1 MAG: Type IV pilus assembly protein PilM [Candidatus Uhrbacteria bacterium GW2011_GWE2_40_58]OGL92404.1 MAG: hypothetical protein A2239_02150 [Candidatus Uhrbacteria bacterium RIFOXYA2_FULL_40_9]OGL96995.1 MAG: hypothetical protein A2332_03955 [Candidatus Uhrbacteria bacterium RIFOXYB2_FULL_41_18]HBK34767.1 hypothetical protein [Candidatus Uhrbacteria bacterium]
MKFFGGKKSNSFLGVDIGASSIKVVELGIEKGRPKLLTYGYSEYRGSEQHLSPFEDVKGTGTLLAEICKKAGSKSVVAMAALPTSGVFSTIISIPAVKDQKEQQRLVDAEVSKLTPLPIEQMITYSTFFDGEKGNEKKDQKKEKQPSVEKTQQKEEKNVRVLVTGAAKTLVQKYVEIFKVAKLSLQAIDTEAFALTRALIGKDKSATLIIDLGSQRTNLTIVEKGIPFISRSMNIGGDTITRRLQEQMQFSFTEAERMKRDLGVTSQTQAREETLPPLLETFIQSLLNEIRYAFQLYANMEMAQQKNVEKVILTGGSAHLPGIPHYLSKSLNLNVYRGDPWARISYPEELRPVLDEVGPRMSVAIGLAMREME